MGRDDFTCKRCCDKEKTLHIHHKFYINKNDPWDYDDDCLVTLCEDCHVEAQDGMDDATKELVRTIKKAGFFHQDIMYIAQAFEIMNPQHLHEVIACSFAKHLINDDLQNEMIDRYLGRIREISSTKCDSHG